MTTGMGGNVGAVVFNATFGNFVGTFVSPLMIYWLIGGQLGDVDFGGSMLQLALTVVLPLMTGMILQVSRCRV
jgi:sodium/bile acid cotransporter 7